MKLKKFVKFLDAFVFSVLLFFEKIKMETSGDVFFRLLIFSFVS